MIDDTVECLSVEGWAVRVVGEERRGQWVERYLEKYRPVSPGISAEFLGHNLMFELRPERAFAVIEREAEFSTRPTRWVFDARR